MATYTYRCAACGAVDLTFPMGEAPARTTCPRCGAWVVRRWTAPMFSRLRPAVRDAHARAERSRDEPEVVSRPGPGRRLH